LLFFKDFLFGSLAELVQAKIRTVSCYVVA